MRTRESSGRSRGGPRTVLDRLGAAAPSLALLAGCGGPAVTPATVTAAVAVATAPIEAGARVVSLAVGHQRACAVRADGRVVCWGGCPVCHDDEPRPEPTIVPGLDDAASVSGDDTRWCAVRRAGGVACWSGTKAAAPVEGVRGAVEVANACARLDDGSVTCWDGRAGAPASPSPVTRLAQGYGSACAIRATGTLVCWEDAFPYPTGVALDRVGAVELPAPRDIELAATSPMRGTCVKSRGRNVECWGGEAAFAAESTFVEGTSDAIALALAEYHGCVLRRDGRVACWGFNSTGQLGVPFADLAERWEARPIEGLTGVAAIATGSGEPSGGAGSTCAVTQKGEVVCWGAIALDDGAVVDLSPGAR